MALRKRFWWEAAGAVASAIFLVLTLAWTDWIELVFGVDPDHHSGSLEWVVVVVSVLVTVGSIAMASFEWRRAARLTT